MRLIYRDIIDIIIGFCGNIINGNSVFVFDVDCSMICVGDFFFYCGVGNRLEFYILEIVFILIIGVFFVEGQIDCFFLNFGLIIF